MAGKLGRAALNRLLEFGFGRGFKDAFHRHPPLKRGHNSHREIVMGDKIFDRENKTMSAAYISEAKGMADFLLTREHRGPGDTIEAAAHRVQTKFGVPSAVLMRLRHREVKDMLLSNFMALASAYRAASEKIEKAYERERENAVDPKILRLADFVAGRKTQEKG